MKVKGKAGIILALVAGAGMIFTIVLTAKKAPEASKMKEEALQKKRQETGNENAELTKLESFKAQAPCYFPVACAAAATVGSVVASQILPQNALNDIKSTFQTYKDITAKVNSVQGEKLISQMTEQKIAQSTDGIRKETFVMRFNDRDIIFETTLLDIMEAEYDVNRLFHGLGYITFNQMLDFFHLEHVDRGDDFGWDAVLGDVWYGYSWIDFAHRRGMKDGKAVTFIEFPFECHPMEEAECETYINHGIEGTA